MLESARVLSFAFFMLLQKNLRIDWWVVRNSPPHHIAVTGAVLLLPDGCQNACLHANFGAAWRTLPDPHRHIHNNLPDIHQSSGEGPLSYGEGAFCMWVAFTECAQFRSRGQIATPVAKQCEILPTQFLHVRTQTTRCISVQLDQRRN